tara:strand:+ start:4578 stop:4889 length:312 start_codon:yes stop_codon:yes gene_type:complete
MKLSYNELYDLTPRAFWNALDGFLLQEEQREKSEWIRCRWQTCYLLNIHLPKHKTIKPTQLIKFDWEQTKISTEDYDAVSKRIALKMKKLGIKPAEKHYKNYE